MLYGHKGVIIQEKIQAEHGRDHFYKHRIAAGLHRSYPEAHYMAHRLGAYFVASFFIVAFSSSVRFFGTVITTFT